MLAFRQFLGIPRCSICHLLQSFFCWYLSIRLTFVGITKMENNTVSYLLLAGKSHETLILISLTDILMHQIRYCNYGVPVGLLPSSFSLDPPVQYFFNW